MRIVWSTLWFLDYRIAVFQELSQLHGVDFYLVYNSDVNSESINQKVKMALGERAIPMTGEKRLGSDSVSGFANIGFRIPYQPGLIKKIKDLKPDVIISDGFFQWTYASLILKAIKGIPHVMCYERTEHTERNAQWVRKMYRKFVLNWIDIICCSGVLCGAYIEKLGFKKGNITYGHMVADVEYLKYRSDKATNYSKTELKGRLGLSSIVYLCVSQMIERKGIMKMLAAWEEFTSSLAEKPSLLLIGSGDQNEIIRTEIQKKELSTVKFIGRIDYDDIVNYYQIADIFILPTLEDNWSLVVSEAMACRLPVITSIYNGCWPELINESNGWIIDPLNHENFVNKLIESYQNRDNFKKMGKASLDLVSNFTPVSAAENIYESCRKAIEKRRHGHS